jgi:hypothetical protein
MTVLFAANSTTDYDSAARVRVVNLSPFNKKPIQFVTDDYFSYYRSIGAWVPVSLGRYSVSRCQIVGKTTSGVSIAKLEYLIEAPGSSWVIIYTVNESEFQDYSSIFSQSADSFSILPAR